MYRSESANFTTRRDYFGEHLHVFRCTFFMTNFIRICFHLSPCFKLTINSLPNDKILDLTKFQAFADRKIILIEKLKFMWERVENIVGKGKNTGYQHFLLFPLCFQKLLFQRCQNWELYGKELIPKITHIMSSIKKNDRLMLLSEI